MDARNGLHWTATLYFAEDETDLLNMYDSGLFPECSLQHRISDVYRTHGIHPLEISICHKGMRPGSTIYTGGDTPMYMRLTGYKITDMANALVPPSGDILIECANKVWVKYKVGANDVQVASFQDAHTKDAQRIAELEEKLKEAQERVNEYALDEQAADAAKITLYNSLSSQLFHGHPGLPPILIAANSTPDQRQQTKKFSAGLDAANEKLREVLAAQTMLTAAKPGGATMQKKDVTRTEEPTAKRAAFAVGNMKEHTASLQKTTFNGQYTLSDQN